MTGAHGVWHGIRRRGAGGRRRSLEGPSILLCVGVYSGFALLTRFHTALPMPLFALLGAMLLALHASMQHEFIHGHPTRWHRVNRLLGFVPLSLWLPFEAYRRSHLVHHNNEALTDPFDDPETYYWSTEGWSRLGPLGRGFIGLHATLLGRLVLGPAWTIGRFVFGEARALLRRDRAALRIWAWHGLGVTAVWVWVVAICRIDPMVYVGCLIYPSVSILLLRSFAEHRAEEGVAERTAIVERAPLFGFLFLYNNLHAAHHESPGLPWYALPAWYRLNRARLMAENGGLVYNGYAEVAWRYLLRPHHVAVHPFRAEARPAGVRQGSAAGSAARRPARRVLANFRRMTDDHVGPEAAPRSHRSGS